MLLFRRDIDWRLPTPQRHGIDVDTGVLQYQIADLHTVVHTDHMQSGELVCVFVRINLRGGMLEEQFADFHPLVFDGHHQGGKAVLQIVDVGIGLGNKVKAQIVVPVTGCPMQLFGSLEAFLGYAYKNLKIIA